MNNLELKQVREYFSALAETETAVGEFYALCAEHWPEEALWKHLAAEELGHGEAVRGMLAAVEAAPDEFSVIRPLTPVPLKLFIEGRRAEIEKVRSGAYTKLNAMAVSCDIEQSIIEARYDKLLKSSNAAYNRAVALLVEDTRRHRSDFVSRLATLGIIK